MSGAKTVVIGLGNTTLSDDGVGPHAARLLAQRLAEAACDPRQVEVAELAMGGLSLMEAMVGFGHAIVLDALQTGRLPVGTVLELGPDDLAGSRHETSVHDMSLPGALMVGRAAHLPLPDEIHLLGIEVLDVTTFGEALSPKVAAAVPELVERALRLITEARTLTERKPTPCG